MFAGDLSQPNGQSQRPTSATEYFPEAWRSLAATRGTWRGETLVPVGKAYSGFTDEQLLRLDTWVRNDTVRRYGPVREITPEIVLEVSFDSLRRSARHKSGVAMRFPRIHWDKSLRKADTLETLERLLTQKASARARRTSTKNIASIRHREAQRKNIPIAELEIFASPALAKCRGSIPEGPLTSGVPDHRPAAGACASDPVRSTGAPARSEGGPL